MAGIRRDFNQQTLTVANAATTSDAAQCGGFSIFGLVVPSSFDGTTITFTVSADNSTFQALYDTTNAQVSMTIAASRSYDLPTTLAAWPFFKIVCGTSQTGATAFILVRKG